MEGHFEVPNFSKATARQRFEEEHPRTPKPKCITSGCDEEQRLRGVCKGCYMTSRYLVRKGKASDEDLVKMGLLHPQKQKGKTPSPFTLAFRSRSA